MRKYAIQSTLPAETKDAFVTRSRLQARDIFISKLLKYLLPVIALEIFVFIIAHKLMLPVLEFVALLLALYDYARALFDFTIEDREHLYSITTEEDSNSEEVESEPINTDNITIIPQATGKGIYYLHVALSSTQLKSIATAMLETGTLTVNFVESLKISRQNAEKIRTELAGLGILQFYENGRVGVTDTGIKICKRILND